MCVLAIGISAGEVLSAFHRDAPYFFWRGIRHRGIAFRRSGSPSKARRIADLLSALRCVLRRAAVDKERTAKNDGANLRLSGSRNLRRDLAMGGTLLASRCPSLLNP
jgi:hypothetical protein